MRVKLGNKAVTSTTVEKVNGGSGQVHPRERAGTSCAGPRKKGGKCWWWWWWWWFCYLLLVEEGGISGAQANEAVRRRGAGSRVAWAKTQQQRVTLAATDWKCVFSLHSLRGLWLLSLSNECSQLA